MKEIFYHSRNIHSRKTIKFGNKSLRLLAAHIWNSFPENEFHMCAVSDLKLLFPNFIVFREFPENELTFLLNNAIDDIIMYKLTAIHRVQVTEKFDIIFF